MRKGEEGEENSVLGETKGKKNGMREVESRK